MRKYSKLMAVLLVFAMILPGVAQAAPVAGELEAAVRLEGSGRMQTAVEVSKEAYAGGSNAVVLAGYSGEVDALTGTLLAAAKDAPVLLTKANGLSKVTEDEIKRLGAKDIYILGGEKAVSEGVKTDLSELDSNINVTRVAGDNRYETAQAVAEEVAGNTSHVFLALGEDALLADALSVGPVSAIKDMPVLLTKKNFVPQSTVDAMDALEVTDVTIVGGENAISDEVEAQLADYNVDRVGAANRERTAVAIAEKYFTNPETAVVAYGMEYADALVGGYLGAMKNAPILLTKTATLHSKTAEYLGTNAKMAYVLGGEKVIAEDTFDEVIVAVEGEEELVVESVSAINQTIASGKDQDLLFEVNGTNYNYETFMKKFGEEGYKVNFYTNKSDLTITKGVVSTDNDFKYSVEVEDKDGNKIPTDATNAVNFADVSVKDDSAEEVTEAKLLQDDELVDFVALKDEDTQFVATKAIDGLGKEMLPKEEETYLGELVVTRATSSNTKIAYFEKNEGIVTLKEGNVTFDVYFNNIDEPVKVPVEVKAERVVDSMKPVEDMKVSTGTVSLADVTVLDQYGEEIEAEVTNKVTDKDNEEVTPEDGKVVLSEAGVYTVKVSVGDKELGSYKIETVKVEEDTKPDLYELEFETEDDEVQDTFDLYEGKNELEIVVKGYKDGVEIDKFHDNIKAETDNDAVEASYEDGVVTVKFAAEKTPKVGDVKVTLYRKEGAMRVDLDSTTVKVVNTAPQITELKLAIKDAKALTLEVEDLNVEKPIDLFTAENIAEQLTAGKDKDAEIFVADKMVKEVKFIERVAKDGKLTGKVHVTLDAKYGGETFVFDAEVTVEEEIIASLEGELGTNKLTINFSHAVDLDEVKIDDLVTFTIKGLGNDRTTTDEIDNALTGLGETIDWTKADIIEAKDKKSITVTLEDGLMSSQLLKALDTTDEANKDGEYRITLNVKADFFTDLGAEMAEDSPTAIKMLFKSEDTDNYTDVKATFVDITSKAEVVEED